MLVVEWQAVCAISIGGDCRLCVGWVEVTFCVPGSDRPEAVGSSCQKALLICGRGREEGSSTYMLINV
jgi:hypothetical protein